VGAKNMTIISNDQGVAAWAKHPKVQFDFRKDDEEWRGDIREAHEKWRKGKKAPALAKRFTPQQLPSEFLLSPHIQDGIMGLPYKIPLQKAAAIRDSKIHGKGFFTDEPVKKGKPIAVAFDERGMQTPEARKTNHSPEPNAEIKKKGKVRFMVALRELDAGEEVTVDYRTLYIPEKNLVGVAPKGSKTGRGVLPSMPSATTDKILKSVRKANRTPPALRRKRRGWARKGT
jgi:hypothetical protein